ncbi:hypothetical protein ACFL3V_02295 [Nanoarchaeota archaeon]
MKIRKRRSKKGYLRTIEAFFAFFITFIFVVFVVLKGIDAKPSRSQFGVLISVEQREDFRECVYAENASCIEDIVQPFIPGSYNYKISINTPEPFKGAKDIYTETIFIASNQTNDFNIIYLYYWTLSG